MTDYEQQAKIFLLKTKTELKIDYLKHDKHFESDKEDRDIYGITIIKGEMTYYFLFGQSIANSGFKLRYKSGIAKGKEVGYTWINQANKESKSDIKLFTKFCLNKFGSLGNLEVVTPQKPTGYDVLSCITKSNPESFKDFCDNFGYDTDSIQALNIYKRVLDEWYNIERLFSPKEIEMLGDIQ